MGANSNIEWTTHTFNPWWGCTKVSDGCKNCYADTLSKRYGFAVWGPTADRRALSEANWKHLSQWNRAAEGASVRPRVFVASMADVFEGPETCQNPEAYRIVEDGREHLFDEILKCLNLDFQLLTKRPQNILRFTPEQWTYGWPANVWLGTSVENQKTADERIPHLVEVPAWVHFLSCEPLLEMSDLSRWLQYPGEWRCPRCQYRLHKRTLSAETGAIGIDPNTAREVCPNDGATLVPASLIEWVICGGESGPHARPMHPDWARSVRDQCEAANVPFFFKQTGEWLGWQHAGGPYWQSIRGDEVDSHAWPDITGEEPKGWKADYHDDVVYQWVGKKAAGDILDGKRYQQFPR